MDEQVPDWDRVLAAERHLQRLVPGSILVGGSAGNEVLAQILDRGEPASWRALYAMARSDTRLRVRIAKIVRTVPVALPRFWLAALASLGEPVDLSAEVPDYFSSGGV